MAVFHWKKVPQPVHRIVDVKTPSSGEEKSFNFTNLQLLQPHDEIKFVIANDNDYIMLRSLCKNIVPIHAVLLTFHR
jgi:7-carboxy-7-deazaguanine synthase